MSKKHYVLVYATSPWRSGEVLLIHKDKPEWQAGRLNLPGGKVEPGELPIATAERELFEETGLPSMLHIQLGTITGDHYHIDAFSCVIDACYTLEPLAGHTEKPEWMNLRRALFDPRLIENLKVILPLCELGVRDWTVRDENVGDVERGQYRIEVTV